MTIEETCLFSSCVSSFSPSFLAMGQEAWFLNMEEIGDGEEDGEAKKSEDVAVGSWRVGQGNCFPHSPQVKGEIDS